MFKIKAHFRRLSNQNLSSNKQNQYSFQNIWLAQNQNEPLPTQVSFKNCAQNLRLPKGSKRLHQKTMTSDRITLDFQTTQSKRSGQKAHFQSEMKKYNLDVKQLGQVSGEVSKQIAQELQKNKVLGSIVTLIRMELQSQPSLMDTGIKKLQQKQQQQIERVKQRIEKVLNQKNKTINEQKKLLEEIQNERKIRLIYEHYFYLLEKQIHKHHLIYTAELTRTASNKFLYLMTSTNDIVSNGHILTLRKDDDKQNEKDLLKNSYMCMPKRENDQSLADQENQGKVKSSKIIGKKKAAKKLVKIMNFIATSKALETEEMDLYDQQENYQKQKGILQSSLRPMMMQRGTTYNQNLDDLSARSFFYQSSKTVPGKKSSHRHKPRSGQMISIKFITQARQFYQEQFESTVYELFKIYHALGINIFAKKQINPTTTTIEKQRLPQDYFTFDQEQLVQQSKRRVEYMRKSQGKMAKFNALLERKIQLVEENIAQTEGFINEMEKQIKIEKQKAYEQPDQSSETQAKSNESIYHTVSNLLGVNPRNYNSQKQIECLIDKLLQAQKQSQNSTKKQSLDLLSQNQQHSIDSTNSHHRIQSRQYLPTLTTFVENQRGSYWKEKTNTQGHQRKFTPLIATGQASNDNNNKKITMNRTCRLIFENGMKSLNNLFDNMNTCQSYQRVFQRVEFEKEYSKEIKKKKRVMFRRQAKVMPDTIE